MDGLFFLSINGNDFAKKLTDFGDDFLSGMVVQRNNIFWQDVFKSWLCYTKKTIKSSLNTKNVFNIPVWYNSNIKIACKYVFIKDWYVKGVKIIGDFLNENGNILSRIDFTERFHFSYIPPMLYNSLICAISKYLTYLSIDKSTLKRDCTTFMPFYYESIFLKEKVTKHIYICLTSNDCVPTAINKWNAELCDILPNDLCVQDVFKICFRTTNDSTVNWLQYRILHRILPVKYYLKKIRITASDCCTFCNDMPETIQHVFANCKKIQPLWNALSILIYEKCYKNVSFDVCNVLFGVYPLDWENRILNFVILYTKQYIFSCLKQNKTPNFFGLLHYLNQRYKIEKYIYIQKSEIEEFEKAWSPWNDFINYLAV